MKIVMVCLLTLCACGIPMPNLPPYAGEHNGAEYFIEKGSGLTLDEAIELVEYATVAWGRSVEELRGLKIGFNATPIECGEHGLADGCYFHEGSYKIIQVSRRNECPYFVPIAHELWHHFYSPGREPDEKDFAVIFNVDENVFTHFGLYCYR